MYICKGIRLYEKTQTQYEKLLQSIKVIVHSKVTHPHVVPNQYDLMWNIEKRKFVRENKNVFMQLELSRFKKHIKSP